MIKAMLRSLILRPLIFLALGTSIAVAQSTDGDTAAVVTGQDYLLAIGDVVEVTVQEDPNLDRRAMIRPDGKINLPLAGTMVAAGSTIEDLQNEVFLRLKSSFVFEPTVTVSLVALSETSPAVASVGEAAIYVLGEVGRAGRYEAELPLDILQALSLAGGPGPFAATKRIQIRRRIDGQEALLFFNYRDVEAGEIAATNMELMDGDVIVVPKRGLFE